MPYTTAEQCIKLFLVSTDTLDAQREQLEPFQRQWLENNGFNASPGQFINLPDAQGQIDSVLVGYDPNDVLTALGAVSPELAVGDYRLAAVPEAFDEKLLLLGWSLGQYRFARYKSHKEYGARLHLPEALRDQVLSLQQAHYMVRDLINTPPLDLGPGDLAQACRECGDTFGADVQVIDGATLENEYPAIHAVGMGSDRGPCLIELTWGQEEHPLICLAGKGVIFDTGGLNLKGGDRMLHMKKDMGGSAHALALARLIMEQQLPVRIKLYIAAVENMVSGRSYRPSDVINTRRGYTVEITNTDAEGRVVLCDALQRACESKPELVIDFATLTGAARIALGPDVPPFFTNRDELSQALMQAGNDSADPVWPLPLVDSYERYLHSHVADMTNCAPSSFAGAINAALFLRRFIDEDIPWIHLDIYGWNNGNRAARPRGGEAQGLRAVFEFLQQRYGA